jgi:hypothetical protein
MVYNNKGKDSLKEQRGRGRGQNTLKEAACINKGDFSLSMSSLMEFDLFPKLKKLLCRKRFRSIEEVPNEVT